MKQFTFPANNSSPGFTIDVDIRHYIQEDQFVTFTLFNENLYCVYKPGMGTITTLSQYLVLGWVRQLFPLCCGLDIVSQLYNSNAFSTETLEKWWEWMKGLSPILKPAIGIVPQIIDGNNVIEPIDIAYKWYASKGVQYGEPFKNINYPNHVLTPYLFFPHKGIEQILKPKFGIFNPQ